MISPYVVKAIGERSSKRYFATAEKFSAQEARRIQLVHKIFSEATFQENCDDYLRKILANGPAAMYQSKRLVELVSNKVIDEELIRETAQRIADIRASHEGREGVSAFLEKRPANWSVKSKTISIDSDKE